MNEQGPEAHLLKGGKPKLGGSLALGRIVNAAG
jgi:hypothetical protein